VDKPGFAASSSERPNSLQASASRSVSDQSDALLVQRTPAGDTQAFSLLVINYERRIQRPIGRRVSHVNLVEDIAQETFICACRVRAQFRCDAQFCTWLYRTAVNTTKKSLPW
jgi:RNA polymerase sigma-70 factor, ECF subfamily